MLKKNFEYCVVIIIILLLLLFRLINCNTMQLKSY